MSISEPGKTANKTSVVIIGSGNVAWSLAQALDSLQDISVSQVASPTPGHAVELCSRLSDAEAVTDISLIRPDADFYIIAVKDGVVAQVAASLPALSSKAIVAHTSGSIPLEALSLPRSGVFYPMQTFSRGQEVDMATVPFFIEATDSETYDRLASLARRLSPNVRGADSETRSVLHASAVFACNFCNHLWAISEEVLRQKDIPFSVMKPLVEETVRKAFASSPDLGQTGPAVRRDLTTIERHAEIVGPPYDELYRTISESIMNRYK